MATKEIPARGTQWLRVVMAVSVLAALSGCVVVPAYGPGYYRAGYYAPGYYAPGYYRPYWR
jgi:hypothetical protein